jgi:drug/metabolite transporter (DMT)-like permease
MKLKEYSMELVLIFVTVIWGLKPTVIKIGLRDISAIDYNVLRLVVATVTAWIAVAVSKKYKPVKKSDIKNILFIAVCGFFIFQWFYGIGIGKTTAGNTSIIMGTVPLLVVATNNIAGIESAEKNTYIGILVSLIGTVIVILGTGEVGLTPENLTGIFYIFVSAIGYAIYMVFSKPLTKKYPPGQITAYAITITTLLTIAFLGLYIQIDRVGFSLIFSLLYSGAIAMYLGNYIWAWAIKRSSSTRVSLYNNLTPVFSVISARIFLGEDFTFIQLIGAAVIVFGLCMTTCRKAVIERQ